MNVLIIDKLLKANEITGCHVELLQLKLIDNFFFYHYIINFQFYSFKFQFLHSELALKSSNYNFSKSECKNYYKLFVWRCLKICYNEPDWVKSPSGVTESDEFL